MSTTDIPSAADAAGAAMADVATPSPDLSRDLACSQGNRN